MSELPDILYDRAMSLIVSLPANDIRLARAAVEGGADILKLHIHIKHQASGTGFGSLAEETDALAEILASVKVPVGLVIGAEKVADDEEMALIEEMGFAYIDAYAHHMPARMLTGTRLPRMVAVEEGYTCLIPELEALGIEMLEAAVVPHEGYGKPLSFYDIALCKSITGRTEMPVVVPTQRAIRPDEVPLLHRAGAAAVMIGAIVTGSTPDGIARVTGEFRQQIERLQLS